MHLDIVKDKFITNNQQKNIYPSNLACKKIYNFIFELKGKVTKIIFCDKAVTKVGEKCCNRLAYSQGGQRHL